MKRCLILLGIVAASSFADRRPYDIETLDDILYEASFGVDDLEHNQIEYIPQRERDGIKQYHFFITEGGWTTNQLIEAFKFISTNNMVGVRWANEEKRRSAGVALEVLSQINRSDAREFISQMCTNSANHYFNTGGCDTCSLMVGALPGVFRYTNFEHEVMAYMRSVCVMTNRYDAISNYISMEMEDSLDCIPAEYKPAATTNFCKYLYFVIGHTTQQMCAQDRVLARLMPPYSNSVQRVQAMNYVVNTATNVYQRAAAQRELARLSQLPTNALNDVSWLTEE